MTEPVVIKAETCNGDTYEIRYYRASDYDALAARLAEAEALLRENCGQIPQPLGWFERVRMFLGIADSATHRETAHDE